MLAAVFWDGGGGDGQWENPFNWTLDTVPTAADDVTIDVPGTASIQINAVSGNRAVHSLLLRENLTISGGVGLTVGGVALVDAGATVMLFGGRIIGGMLDVTAGSLSVNSSTVNRLSGVSVVGSIALSAANGRMGIEGAVSVTGGITVSGSGAEIGMADGALLNAEVNFPGSASGRRIGALSPGASYTLGPGANIHGGAFIVGRQFGGTAWPGVSVLNLGRIAADTVGVTTLIDATVFSNAGVLHAGPGNLQVSSESWSSFVGAIEVSAGAFDLNGVFDATGGIGSWTRSGGDVNILGSVQNVGGTLSLDDHTGEWTLAGGSITGGVVSIATGGALGMNSNPNNRLNSLTINGDITLPSRGDRLSIGADVVINGVISLVGANTELGLADGAVLDTEVLFPGTAGGRGIGPTGDHVTYTLGSAANVHGGPFEVGRTYAGTAWAGVTAISLGRIAADTAGYTAIIDPGVFTNSGTLSAGPGNVLVAAASWSNASGTIEVGGGTMSIDGVLVTGGGRGTWARTGGNVNVTGTVDNSGGTLALGPDTGQWVLAGGTITGGSIVVEPGGGLGMNGNPANRLSSLSFIGSLSLVDSNDRLSLGPGVVVSGTITVSAAGAEIGVVDGAQLNAEVIFPGSVQGRHIGPTTMNATYTIAPGARIHGGAFTIGRVYGGSSWTGTTVINRGEITPDAAGLTLTIDASVFMNAGTLRAGPGNLGITAGAWTNSMGTIDVQSGTLTLGGSLQTAPGLGTWSRSGGAVNLTGMVNNTGGMLLLDSGTGEWALSGGAIVGGVLVINAGGALGMTPSAANRLENLTVNGSITLADQGDRLSFAQTVRVNGTVIVAAARAEIGMADGAVLIADVEFPGAATGRKFGPVAAGAMFTFGAGSLIHGGVFGIGSTFGGTVWGGTHVVNAGVISADGAGAAVTIDAPTVTNTGTFRATGGGSISVAASALTNLTDGTLTGGTWIAEGESSLLLTGGAIATNDADVTVGGPASFPALAPLGTNNGTLLARGGGTFAITPAGGILVNAGAITIAAGNVLGVAGGFQQDPAGVLTAEMRGGAPADIGRLSVTGPAQLAGAAVIAAVQGYVPACVGSVFVDAASISGEFSVVSLPPVQGSHTAMLVYAAGEVRFVTSADADFNHDGSLNSQDLFDFLVAFFDGRADFNGDGMTNSQDFFDFLADFFGGC